MFKNDPAPLGFENSRKEEMAGKHKCILMNRSGGVMKKLAIFVIGILLIIFSSACRRTVTPNPNLNANNLFTRSDSGSGLDVKRGAIQGTSQGYTNKNSNIGTSQGLTQGYGTGVSSQGNSDIGNSQRYNNQGVTAGYFTDGVYAGSGVPTATGNQMALVYIKGGKIINVALNSIDAKGNTIFDSTGRINTGTTSSANNNAANGSNITNDRINLANAIIQHQTPDVNINVSSANGAIINNWKLAVSRALARAIR